MIQIKDLTVKNFMSVGNTTQGINFDRQDLTLVPGEIKFESVDQIVTDQITNIESEFYDNRLLLKIYQNL
jgi:hypothetical protein